MRSDTWNFKETKYLLDIWSSESIQKSLKEINRNRRVWEDIATKLNEKGIGDLRTYTQCKDKVRNLVGRYRKVISHNSQSGNEKISCPFYDKIHKIVQFKPTAEELNIVSSIKDKSDEDSETLEIIPDVRYTDISDPYLEASVSNGQDRLHSEDEEYSSVPSRLDEQSSHLNDDLISYIREIDKRYIEFMKTQFEREERREEKFWAQQRKLEEERRKWEAEQAEKQRQHELKIVQLLASIIDEKCSENR
ncbi:Zinc finger and SCAN domain-containing protein 20 [Nymphon striatum]|nr:Zinc finger and SCAN domain-containing protein 20 [Nymphon striatum]